MIEPRDRDKGEGATKRIQTGSGPGISSGLDRFAIERREGKRAKDEDNEENVGNIRGKARKIISDHFGFCSRVPSFPRAKNVPEITTRTHLCTICFGNLFLCNVSRRFLKSLKWAVNVAGDCYDATAIVELQV